MDINKLRKLQASGLTIGNTDSFLGKKPNIPIIGICGQRNSGKDTVASHLVKHYDYKRLAFADAVREVVAYLFDLPYEKLQGLNDNDRTWRTLPLTSLGKTPIQLMQLVGTEVVRHIHPDVWVNKLFSNREKGICGNEICEKNYNIVIPDVRFLNEIRAIQNRGGIVIYLDRPKNLTVKQKMLGLLGMYGDRHISEKVSKLEKFCNVKFINDQTQEYLIDTVDDFMGEINNYVQ